MKAPVSQSHSLHKTTLQLVYKLLFVCIILSTLNGTLNPICRIGGLHLQLPRDRVPAQYIIKLV